MKTINFKKVLSLTALALVVNIAWSIEPVIKVTGDKKFQVKLSNVPDNAQLTIKDLDGVILYTEAISKTTGEFQKIYNMENLPDGKYEIFVDGNLKTVSFPMTVKSDIIDLSSNVKTEFYKPTFTTMDKKVLLMKMNHDNSPLHVNIYNSYNQIVFDETISAKNDIKRIYNFSQLQGEFKIVVESDSNTYFHTLSVK